MWTESFSLFLKGVFQRIQDWAHSVKALPAGLARWSPAGLRANLPPLLGLGPGETQVSLTALPGGWYAEISYHYRSLDCQLRISLQEPTPGMQRIYRALQATDEV